MGSGSGGILLAIAQSFALSLALVIPAAGQQSIPPQQPAPTPAAPVMPSVRLPSGRAGLTSPIDNAMVKTDSAPAGALPPVVPDGRPSIGLVAGSVV